MSSLVPNAKGFAPGPTARIRVAGGPVLRNVKASSDPFADTSTREANCVRGGLRFANSATARGTTLIVLLIKDVNQCSDRR
jgi:hypothetical protein